MQTPSHFIISSAIGRNIVQPTIKFSWMAFLIGSVLPDIPFTLLTLGGEIFYRWFAPLPVTGVSIMEYLHFDLFFTSWWWIVPHNFFHSIVINGVLIILGWWLWQKNYSWGRFIFWLAISTQLHTVIDIFTHTSDGPLFLFPLSLTYRFASPISYWESESFGRLFIFFEYGLDIFLLVYLWWSWRKNSVPALTTQEQE
ncbi:MAG: membrane-bound metal-dependent hydrolase YbcI (DUF457 family) [Cellvibrionaceae bacterium]|jgi:membrane-bound metal-dependent hydrolase YbcI (DUF457 family)